MSALFIVLTVVQVLFCGSLIGIILMQSKNASGITGNLGGMGLTPTYWDKNKGRSLEGKLEKYTKIIATLFFILTIILNVVK